MTALHISLKQALGERLYSFRDLRIIFFLYLMTESLIINCFEEGSAASGFAYRQFFTALEQTVEELAKCFLLEFGDNRELSFGRCESSRSFDELYEGLKSIQ